MTKEIDRALAATKDLGQAITSSITITKEKIEQGCWFEADYQVGRTENYCVALRSALDCLQQQIGPLAQQDRIRIDAELQQSLEDHDAMP